MAEKYCRPFLMHLFDFIADKAKLKVIFAEESSSEGEIIARRAMRCLPEDMLSSSNNSCIDDEST